MAELKNYNEVACPLAKFLGYAIHTLNVALAALNIYTISIADGYSYVSESEDPGAFITVVVYILACSTLVISCLFNPSNFLIHRLLVVPATTLRSAAQFCGGVANRHR
jgi:hypothetical protein